MISAARLGLLYGDAAELTDKEKKKLAKLEKFNKKKQQQQQKAASASGEKKKPKVQICTNSMH